MCGRGFCVLREKLSIFAADENVRCWTSSSCEHRQFSYSPKLAKLPCALGIIGKGHQSSTPSPVDPSLEFLGALSVDFDELPGLSQPDAASPVLFEVLFLSGSNDTLDPLDLSVGHIDNLSSR